MSEPYSNRLAFMKQILTLFLTICTVSFGHGGHHHYDFVAMLVQGRMEYSKTKTSVKLESLREVPLKSQPFLISRTGSFQITPDPKKFSALKDLVASVTVSPMGTDALILGTTLNFPPWLGVIRKSDIGLLKRTPGRQYESLTYSCVNSVSTPGQKADVLGRDYLCIAIQSLNHRPIYNNVVELESSLNRLKLKSIAPDLF